MTRPKIPLETVLKKASRTVGITIMGATNFSCLGIGLLEGRLNAMGIKADIPLEPFWGTNIVGTAAGGYMAAKGNSSLQFADYQPSGQELVVKGAFFGAMTAPIGYALGYALGYMGTWAAENFF